MRAISYFLCGVVEALALSVINHYKFQTKYTYCLRKQSCLFVESRKTELKNTATQRAHGSFSTSNNVTEPTKIPVKSLLTQ